MASTHDSSSSIVYTSVVANDNRAIRHRLAEAFCEVREPKRSLYRRLLDWIKRG